MMFLLLPAATQDFSFVLTFNAIKMKAELFFFYFATYLFIMVISALTIPGCFLTERLADSSGLSRVSSESLQSSSG